MTQNSIQRRYRRQWQASKENTKQDSKLNSTEKSNIRCWHSLLINGHRSFMCTCKHHEGGGYSEHPSVKSFQQFLVRWRRIQKIPGMDFPRFEFFSDIKCGCIPPHSGNSGNSSPPQWEQSFHKKYSDKYHPSGLSLQHHLTSLSRHNSMFNITKRISKYGHLTSIVSGFN